MLFLFFSEAKFNLGEKMCVCVCVCVCVCILVCSKPLITQGQWLIPRIVAHDRFPKQTFTFSFRFQCPMLYCAFHLCDCFSGGFRQGCGVIIVCIKIFACLISVNVLMRFIMIINNIYIIIIITTIVMIITYLCFAVVVVLMINQYFHN